MKIFVICSKNFYRKIETVKTQLEKMGHTIFLPNCYDAPDTEAKIRKLGKEEHQKFKAEMYKQSEETIKGVDAVLVLNFNKEKDGQILKNYIGGATFLEMYDAFRNNKRIYLYNEISEGMLYDEIVGFAPIILNGNLEIIKN